MSTYIHTSAPVAVSVFTPVFLDMLFLSRQKLNVVFACPCA